MPDFSQMALRVVCAGAVVYAVLNTTRDHRPSPLGGPLVETAQAAVVAPPADAWSVEVDGWRIVVDGVAIAPDEASPRAVVPALLAEPDEFRGYGELIGRFAEEVGLDWRLVAAVAYEESRFDPYAVSPAGAFGLMQVREIAARDVGLSAYVAPEANVRAGTRYLRAMAERFSSARGRDRDALMLAAYNMGPGHVLDAQELAREMGFPPTVWDGAMEEVVRLLERPAFFARLPNGYAQGESVVAYVNRVLARYGQYRRSYPSEPILAAR